MIGQLKQQWPIKTTSLNQTNVIKMPYLVKEHYHVTTKHNIWREMLKTTFDNQLPLIYFFVKMFLPAFIQQNN